jgi:hypothetical protein
VKRFQKLHILPLLLKLIATSLIAIKYTNTKKCARFSGLPSASSGAGAGAGTHAAHTVYEKARLTGSCPSHTHQ